MDDVASRASTSKRQKIDEVEIEVEDSGTGGIKKDSWEEMITALQVIGVRISDLTRSMSTLGSEVSEMAKTSKITSDTAKELLVEFRDLTWIQNQTKGLLHVVAKRLESLDGVEVIEERGAESEMRLKSGKNGEEENNHGKGKGKEVVPDLEDAKEQESEGLEGDEEEEVDEDVVKGPEISTLDVDESMEVEKK